MRLKMRSGKLVQRVSFALSGMVLLLLFAVLATPVAAAPRADAYVRVVHASPVAGDVDVFVDGTKLLSNFAFGTVTDYVNLAAGSHKIQVAPAGKGADAAVITQDVSVGAGIPYTVAAVGTGADNLGLVAFGDNNLVTGDGQAKVRVYHLSPDAGPVNVAAGGNTVITGLTYQKASDYLMVPANSYTFDVTATDANATVPVKATIEGNTVNSVFAVGLLKGDPKLKFVLASVKGVPGMPNTGSDPNPLQNQPLLPWVLGLTAVALLGAGVVARRSVRQK